MCNISYPRPNPQASPSDEDKPGIFVENIEKSRYLAIEKSYIAMKNDSTLIIRGDSLDSDFTSFFLQIDSSNIGKFQSVQKLAITNPDSARAINASIADTNYIEGNLKTFYELYCGKIIDSISMNFTDSSFLESILTGSALTEGDVFFDATAILFREIHPNSNSSRIVQHINTDILLPINILNENVEVKIYPNPSQSNLYIDLKNTNDKIKLIQIYNTSGKEIYSQNFNENLVKLNLNSYVNGLYFIRVTTNNGVVKTGYFNIIN